MTGYSEAVASSYARAQVARLGGEADGIMGKLASWYLYNLREGWDAIAEDVAASWDATRGDGPAWADLGNSGRGAYVGTYAAECACRALEHLEEWDVTDCMPDADDVWSVVA